MHSGEINSRSPFSTETDDSYCLEALGSPWPVAVGFPGLPGSKNHYGHGIMVIPYFVICTEGVLVA